MDQRKKVIIRMMKTKTRNGSQETVWGSDVKSSFVDI